LCGFSELAHGKLRWNTTFLGVTSACCLSARSPSLKINPSSTSFIQEFSYVNDRRFDLFFCHLRSL
ncbi:MAG: hypothetical protein Q8M33_05840, partial [Hydrogenophaga sp.]|nr:hypothetical protein [Hydrogenophaga sp.]